MIQTDNLKWPVRCFDFKKPCRPNPPNYIIPDTSPTQPRVKLTAGPMCNVYRDGRTFAKQRLVFSFWIYKQLCYFANFRIAWMWGYSSSKNISFFPWNPQLLDPLQSPGGPITGWLVLQPFFNCSFLGFWSTLSPDGPITGWSVLQSFSDNI